MFLQKTTTKLHTTSGECDWQDWGTHISMYYMVDIVFSHSSLVNSSTCSRIRHISFQSIWHFSRVLYPWDTSRTWHPCCPYGSPTSSTCLYLCIYSSTRSDWTVFSLDQTIWKIWTRSLSLCCNQLWHSSWVFHTSVHSRRRRGQGTLQQRWWETWYTCSRTLLLHTYI